MFKLQVFSSASTSKLQDIVNEWFAVHKEVFVVHSNLNSAAGPDVTSGNYTFYILYTTTANQEAELKEIAAEAKSEASVEATEINPEVLTPTS